VAVLSGRRAFKLGGPIHIPIVVTFSCDESEAQPPGPGAAAGCAVLIGWRLPG
jgi:hypothetical protein